MPISSSWITICAAFGATVVTAPSAHAEIRGVVEHCSGGKLCPWFQPVLTPPAGWAEDDRTAHEHRLAVLVPKGKTFRSAPARIYGKAFFNGENLSVGERVRISNEKWKAMSPNASVERLADVSRGEGRPAFQLYRYTNPYRTRQAAELTAFGEEQQDNGNRFGVLIVLTATTAKDLAANEPAYRTLLERF